VSVIATRSVEGDVVAPSEMREDGKPKGPRNVAGGVYRADAPPAPPAPPTPPPPPLPPPARAAATTAAGLETEPWLPRPSYAPTPNETRRAAEPQAPHPATTLSHLGVESARTVVPTRATPEENGSSSSSSGGSGGSGGDSGGDPSVVESGRGDGETKRRESTRAHEDNGAGGSSGGRNLGGVGGADGEEEREQEEGDSDVLDMPDDEAISEMSKEDLAQQIRTLYACDVEMRRRYKTLRAMHVQLLTETHAGPAPPAAALEPEEKGGSGGGGGGGGNAVVAAPFFATDHPPHASSAAIAAPTTRVPLSTPLSPPSSPSPSASVAATVRAPLQAFSEPTLAHPRATCVHHDPGCDTSVENRLGVPAAAAGATAPPVVAPVDKSPAKRAGEHTGGHGETLGACTDPTETGRDAPRPPGAARSTPVAVGGSRKSGDGADGGGGGYRAGSGGDTAVETDGSEDDDDDDKDGVASGANRVHDDRNDVEERNHPRWDRASNTARGDDEGEEEEDADDDEDDESLHNLQGHESPRSRAAHYRRLILLAKRT